MRLINALEIINRELPPGASQQRVFLACGITPLHLETFLKAHLRTIFSGDRIVVDTGLFGDLAGSLASVDISTHSAVAVIIEWADLDPRLGFRRLAGWRPSDLTDILTSVNEAVDQLHHHLVRLARAVPAVVSMPTLPVPPISWSKPYQECGLDLNLQQAMTSFASSLAAIPGIRVLKQDYLARISPPGERYDLKSDLTTGFPYTLSHASHLADLLSRLIENRQHKKGIITDLDGTLWAGILGEDGTDGISWSLDHHTHHHGLYQQLLASLASAGTLIAVASKNDISIVEKAFERRDLRISSTEIFPFEAHWSRKSESVERILQAWNVGPESVVFIDDRPEEVAEVQSAHPRMECIVFPQNDYSALLHLFQHLRETFGKTSLTAEDAIRLNSIRSSYYHKSSRKDDLYGPSEQSRQLSASLTFVRTRDQENIRGHELLNKTNQFNLNGRRYSEAEWRRLLSNRGTKVLLVSYQDKFGPLGTIAIIVGRVVYDRFFIDAWAMSCRAFARHIEHHCLKYLFESFAVERVQFDFQATLRNAPVQNFLGGLLGTAPTSGAVLTRSDFFNRAHDLNHDMVSIHEPTSSDQPECALPR